jgi:ABC-type multidrug transport system fused ATPase/permease subunit
MGALITFFVAALAVSCDTFLGRYIGDNFISPGYLALGLNYSFLLTGSLKFLIRSSAMLEAQMNSVERVKFYSEQIEQELSEGDGSGVVVPNTWPERGRVEGRGIQMRYRDGPLVLKGLSVIINAGEKIGVAGRTG